MMRACGVATTLCPLISMMRCPTRTPPRSAMPPRRRLQTWRDRQGPRLLRPPVLGAPTPTPHPQPGPGSHDAVLHAEAQLLVGVGPADDGRGDWRTVDDAEGYHGL